MLGQPAGSGTGVVGGLPDTHSASAGAASFQQTPVSLSGTSLPVSCTCTALRRSLLIPKQVNTALCLGLGFPQLTDLFTFTVNLRTDFLSWRGRHDLELSGGAK